MLARIYSGTTIGLDGVLISVEVDVANRGFPSFTIVGLPGKSVDEAKDRVRTAIVNTSFDIPDSRITVNLAPADIPKEGSAYDLPIAVGILAASGVIDKTVLSTSMFAGELSLEGLIVGVPGILPLAVLTRQKGFTQLFVPQANAEEATLIDGITIYSVSSLTQLVLHLNGQSPLQPYVSKHKHREEPQYEVDFVDIKGQEQAKRALEIASAGFHNIHLTGPPGAGKTLLSRAFPSILPPLEKPEIIEVSKIYSICGLLGTSSFISKRPFRSPHHTTSRVGLIGGGTKPAPGEISLAHRGVLFLDELNEFPRSVLEALRQPMEDGKVSVSRAAGTLTLPSRFILLAASNPCPCGFLGHPKKRCVCNAGSILRYRKKLSGPLMDRVDLHIHVPAVTEEELHSNERGEDSARVRFRVQAARKLQESRFSQMNTKTNGEMSSALVQKACKLSSSASDYLKKAVSIFSLSARSYYKVIKVAQTIADIMNAPVIEQCHVSESLQYRLKE